MTARSARGRAAWAAVPTALFASAYAVATARPALADNCQTFTDCFATANAGSDALLGLTFLGMLSMAISFVPYVGTAKGVTEAVVGRDLLTGQALSATDRLLGVVPGGLGRGGRVAGAADDLADAGRTMRYADDAGDVRRSSHAYGVGEHGVARYGRGPFRNRRSDVLADELRAADAAGIRPITPDAATFDEVVNGGTIKWAVTTDGELRIIPASVPGHGEVPHSVLTRGEPVLAAGQAEISTVDGIRFGTEITPHSGHFRPSLQSLEEVGRVAFARYGITFPPMEVP